MDNIFFTVSALLVLILAKLDHEAGITGGWLRPEITYGCIAMPLLFFINSLTLPQKEPVDAIHQWGLHLLIQGYMYIMFPCIVLVVGLLAWLLPSHEPILEGLLLLSLVPPAAVSSIQLTRLVNGNVALATVNVIIGDFIGVFVSTVFASILQDFSEALVKMGEMFVSIIIFAIVPTVAGHIIKSFFYSMIQPIARGLNVIAVVFILYLFYVKLCAAFKANEEHNDLDTLTFVMVAILVSLLFVGTNLFLLILTHKILKYSRADAAAVANVGTRRSLVLGLPLIGLVLGDHPDFGCMLLTMIMYSFVQIVLGSISTEPLRLWVAAGAGAVAPKKRKQRSC